jgi:membrane associated rhomboid family serine protease
MRALIVSSIAVICAAVGLLGDIVFWQGEPKAPVLAVGGLLVGLLLGLLVVRLAFPRRPSARRDRGLQLMQRHRRS